MEGNNINLFDESVLDKTTLLSDILDLFDEEYAKEIKELSNQQRYFFKRKVAFLTLNFSPFLEKNGILEKLEEIMKKDMLTESFCLKKITGKDLLMIFGFNYDEYNEKLLNVYTVDLDCNNVNDVCGRIEALYIFYKHKVVTDTEFSVSIKSALDFYFQSHFKNKAKPDDYLKDIFIELLNRNKNLFFDCMSYIREFRDMENYCKIIKLHNSLIDNLKEEMNPEIYTHIFIFSAHFLKALYRDDVNFDMWDDKATHFMRRKVERKIFEYAISHLKSSFKNSIDLECLVDFFWELPRFAEGTLRVSYFPEDKKFNGWYKKKFLETFKGQVGHLGQVTDNDFSHIEKNSIDYFKSNFGNDFSKFFEIKIKRSQSVKIAHRKPSSINKSVDQSLSKFFEI